MKLLPRRENPPVSLQQHLKDNLLFTLTIVIPLSSSIFEAILFFGFLHYIQAGFLIVLAILQLTVISLISLRNKYMYTSRSPQKASSKVTPQNTYDRFRKLIPKQVPYQVLQNYVFASKAELQKLKYCFCCKVYRPFGTVHCSKCDECCLKFDHHCVWLKACICAYNYKMFILLLQLLVASSLFHLLLAIDCYRL